MKRILYLVVVFIVLLVYGYSIEKTSAQTWAPTNGPFGGQVECFAENSSYLFAGVGFGTIAKGIFRSSDHGANWTAVNNGLPTTAFGYYIVSLIESGSYIVASTGTGIYRSANNGDTWTLVTNYPGQYVPVAFVTDGTNLFAGGYEGFYISMDNGLNWTTPDYGSGPTPTDIKALAYCGTYLYAACAPINVSGQGYVNSVYRSVDNGVSWETVYDGLSDATTYTFNNFAVIGTDIYVSNIGKGVYHLANNGSTWTAESANLTGTAKNVLSLMIKDNTIYCGGNDGLWSSSLSGTLSWTRTNNNLGNLTNQGVSHLFKSGSDVFVGIGYRGVYLSTDNLSSWTASNNGLSGASGDRLTNIGTDLYSVSSYSNLLYKSTDLGETWEYENISTEIGPWLHGTTLFCGSGNGSYISRSFDNGASWQQLTSFYDLTWGSPTAFLSKGDTIFAGGGGGGGATGIFYSLDNCETWNQSVGCDVAPNSITVIGNTMYAGGTSAGSFISNDNGLNWTSCFPSLSFGSLYFNGSNIYALAGGTDLLVSTDNGTTWTSISITDRLPQTLAFNGTDIYTTTIKLIGTTYVAGGIYKSTDNGVNWTEFDEGLTNLPFASSLVVEGNYLFVNNSTGLPVYRRALSGSVPAQTSPVVGVISPCANSTQTYSVDNVADVTYTWEVPQDWSITAGQNTNSVTVIAGSFAGYVKVTPSNGWGSGPAQTLTVTPSGSAPLQPGIISGDASPCLSSTQTYSVTNSIGLSYNWTLPTDWTLISGQNTNSISVTVGNASGNILVTPSNSCDAGIPQMLAVTTSQIPAQPSVITGSYSPGVGSVQFYNVTNTIGVSYDWTLPSGWILNAGGTTNSIAVTVGSSTGDISCTPSNACGIGITRTLTIAFVGIEELNSNKGFSIYPNPAKGIVSLNFKGNTGDIKIVIKNTLGGLISSENVNVVSGNFTKTIDLSKYPAGIYYLQIIGNGKIYVQKVVKQ